MTPVVFFYFHHCAKIQQTFITQSDTGCDQDCIRPPHTVWHVTNLQVLRYHTLSRGLNVSLIVLEIVWSFFFWQRKYERSRKWKYQTAALVVNLWWGLALNMQTSVAWYWTMWCNFTQNDWWLVISEGLSLIQTCFLCHLEFNGSESSSIRHM